MISSQTDRSTFSSYVWSSRAQLELDIHTWQFCRLRRSVCLLCGNKPHIARSRDTTRRYSCCPNRTATS
ncbi:hypothetical protein ALC56_03248 [Trachymyrmex septentrionalis]|uniref:Uncharacterized protein n=2 Tax=Attini TaxID=143999 RepID=A0A195FNH1_9HYME|nr:hypothetical protein ALC53_05242 [Atta colombica]KYN42110.1 hypothetical protein ALC56_03248 [Trachymyrmex septentrionalis]